MGRQGTRTAIAAALTALALAVALAGGASAQAASQPSFAVLEAQKPIGDGLALKLLSFGESGREHLFLSISRGGPAASSSVEYSPVQAAPGRGPRFLRSRLGQRGRVAMRFVPSRRTRSGTSGCDDFTYLEGHLVGHLRFRGEQHWVDLRETRLPATLAKTGKPACRQSRPRNGALLASCSENGSTFLATRSPNGRLAFSASSPLRKSRGLYVHTQVTLGDAAGDFTYSDDLRRAKVAPPDPFAGTARFTHRRLHSSLSFEPLHGPTAMIEDGDAYMRRIGNGSYAIACVAYLPRGLARLEALQASATLRQSAARR